MKLRAKWMFFKQTLKQFGNFVMGESLTERGMQMYRYCCKVFFEEHQPETYAEILYEDDLQAWMKENEFDDRKTAALMAAGILVSHIPPHVYHKEYYKIVQG